MRIIANVDWHRSQRCLFKQLLIFPSQNLSCFISPAQSSLSETKSDTIPVAPGTSTWKLPLPHRASVCPLLAAVLLVAVDPSPSAFIAEDRHIMTSSIGLFFWGQHRCSAQACACVWSMTRRISSAQVSPKLLQHEDPKSWCTSRVSGATLLRWQN